MVTQVAPNLYRIPVPLPGNPLKNLNAYLIRGHRNLLVDTGFRQEACRMALKAGLVELGVDMADTDIFLTHLHSDHAGLAPELLSPTSRLFIGDVDRQRLPGQTPSIDARWGKFDQLMAAQGYVVVAPNRRGLPSFGQEWLDQISGDYSGQNIRDYLSAIDDVAREPWCDRDRLGCVGASYGGYSVYFLAGCHQKRFKAFIAHCGIFNFESMYGQTEELFFINHDYGGAYWEKDNPTAMRSYANSPHKFVDRWDTPILIVTGEYDFRIPYTQSLEAFTAARLHGIPARLVAFEDEAHQVFKPQNSVVWNREFFGWLDKYVKEAR